MLDEKQIEQNWNNLITFIENTFDGEREERLLELYTSYADRIATAPASNRVNFHSCFVGGYMYHVLNVIKCANKVHKLWMGLGGNETYTEEELNFVALNHDLGKIGNLDYEYYVQTDEQWKIKRGQLYDFHPELQYMAVQDRSIFWLQHFGVTISQNEYLGIKLHDGLYDEGNKSYYITYDPRFGLRTMLPHIVHWGDMMAFKLEYEEWLGTSDGMNFMKSGGTHSGTPSIPKKKKKPTLEPSVNVEASDIQSFEELFGDALSNITGKEDKEKKDV